MSAAPKLSNKRIVIFSLWIVVAIPLLIVFGPRLKNLAPDTLSTPSDTIEAVVDRALRAHRIEPRAVKTRRVTVGNQGMVRVERRVAVSTSFNPLALQHDLSSALEPLGASVIATERSIDKSVAMHIKKDGMIIESLAFVPTP
ncbi:MAG: hypothetical protein C4326_09695 [Ignavibacteria bacterium]